MNSFSNDQLALRGALARHAPTFWAFAVVLAEGCFF